MKRHSIIRLIGLIGLIGFSAQAEWERDSRSLLTNFNNMYSPCVVETGGEYRFKMWFFGWATAMANPEIPGADAIYHARSKDLQSWEVYCRDGSWDTSMKPARWWPVLHASVPWYEAWHVGDPSVVLKDGKFYMAYSATTKPFGKKVEGFPSGMGLCVMGAVSDDGIHWKKSKQPLLINPQDSAHPKPSSGRIGDFHRPSLLWDEGRWRLWFDYWLPAKNICMGYAENAAGFLQPGGFEIRHDLEKPLLALWPNPDVVRVGDTYHCFADPPGWPIAPGESEWKARQLREAVSADGLHWTKLSFIPPDPDTEACHVPQALVAKIDGRQWLYLFYATQIGTRKNDGQYHYQYDRIRAMRRPIAKRPNLLYIMEDDQRFDTLGYNGNPVLKMLNIDSLAQRGGRFTEAFATQIRDLGKTYPELLQETGYYMGFIGKWGTDETNREYFRRVASFFDFWGISMGQSNYWHERDCHFVLNNGLTDRTVFPLQLPAGSARRGGLYPVEDSGRRGEEK